MVKIPRHGALSYAPRLAFDKAHTVNENNFLCYLRFCPG